jgi:ATP-dependent DNA helicase RecG
VAAPRVTNGPACRTSRIGRPALETPLSQLTGVGPERASQLARLGLHTVWDLLRHRPRRHEDRRHFLTIADLRRGQAATVRGRIVAQGTKGYSRGRSVFEFILEDGTGRLHCRWWNLPFMAKYFSVGDEVMVYGKASEFKPLAMDHPETEVVESQEERLVHLDRIVPVYPLTEGLPQRWLRSLVWRVLEGFADRIRDPWPEQAMTAAGWRRNPLGWVRPLGVSGLSQTASAVGDHSLDGDTSFVPALANAIRWLHFPETGQRADLARQRLALDEFIDLQVQMRQRRLRMQAAASGRPCQGDNRIIKPFLKQLGFKLTLAQTAVLKEIRKDMGELHPMRRLLQGDVGSGKTVVAACTILMALESGFNALLMAPTEILAEQHFHLFKRWLEPLRLRVALQTGSTKTLDKSQPLLEAGQGGTLAIGTHALIQPGFSLDRLGLVVIDEQHKFGVAQREALVRKGHYPHLLVMTATPIPRTLGLTMYGDLDISVIASLPPGRGSIRTYIRGPQDLPKVNAFMKSKVTEGRQAYVVFPRVEDSDLKTGTKAVKQEFARLQAEFAPAQVALLHGRLRSEEKETVMADFRQNKAQILLSTTVVEVGVDVPNATVMLIENAELYGLAQLHQLRGRIGRGKWPSYCILATACDTPEVRQRLAIMEETTDGFRIAEEDLKLRGPGELLGQDQSGLPAFRFGDLTTDRQLIEHARRIAGELVAAKP